MVKLFMQSVVCLTIFCANASVAESPVSYTHLTLPTN